MLGLLFLLSFSEVTAEPDDDFLRGRELIQTFHQSVAQFLSIPAQERTQSNVPDGSVLMSAVKSFELSMTRPSSTTAESGQDFLDLAAAMAATLQGNHEQAHTLLNSLRKRFSDTGEQQGLVLVEFYQKYLRSKTTAPSERGQHKTITFSREGVPKGSSEGLFGLTWEELGVKRRPKPKAPPQLSG